MTAETRDRAAQFLALHHGDAPLVLANAWDVGSARLFASLGCAAIATTSSGYAATLGRLDYAVSLDEALAHCRAMAGAVDIPVSADFENGFAHEPAAVADTVAKAVATGISGLSIEDFTGDHGDPLYEPALAAARIEAAADAAHAGSAHTVLTGRAEGAIRGRPDLGDIITRLQSFEAHGADVLFAPGLTDLGEITNVVRNVDRPVNILLRPGGPTVAELASVGVKRVSVGGSLAFAALGAAAAAVHELLDTGTLGFLTGAAEGSRAARAAFTP